MNHPHSRMLEEVLRNGYSFTKNGFSVFVLNVIGNKTSYQVYNEKTNDSKVFFAIKDAVDNFLYMTRKLNG